MSESTPEVAPNDERQTQVANEEVNQRLLRESQENKRKAQEYRKQLDDLESFKRMKLEEEGNFKSLLESEKARADRLEKEAKELRQKTLRSNIVSTISKLAGDVYDLDDVLNQPKFAHYIEEGIDEDSLTLREESAKNYLDKVFEVKPHLKKSSNSVNTHKAGKPGFVEKDQKEKSFAEMSLKERADLKMKLILSKKQP